MRGTGGPLELFESYCFGTTVFGNRNFIIWVTYEVKLCEEVLYEEVSILFREGQEPYLLVGFLVFFFFIQAGFVCCTLKGAAKEYAILFSLSSETVFLILVVITSLLCLPPFSFLSNRKKLNIPNPYAKRWTNSKTVKSVSHFPNIWQFPISIYFYINRSPLLEFNFQEENRTQCLKVLLTSHNARGEFMLSREHVLEKGTRHIEYIMLPAVLSHLSVSIPFDIYSRGNINTSI